MSNEQIKELLWLLIDTTNRFLQSNELFPVTCTSELEKIEFSINFLLTSMHNIGDSFSKEELQAGRQGLLEWLRR